MKSLRLRDIVLAAAVAAMGVAGASPAIAATYDGHWSLVAKTTKGHCGVTQWGVAISGGRLYYPGGFFMGYPVGLSGVVSRSGHLKVNVMAGPRIGTGTGRLGKVRGSGTWAGRGPSGTCSGVWTAARLAAAPAYGFGGAYFWPAFRMPPQAR